MKQITLFPSEETEEKKYTAKIEAPIYEPKGQPPHLLMLCDDSKTRRLIAKIDSFELPDDVKVFLRKAAHRHTVFHYERIADYYAHAAPKIQRLMEDSALVIIDFDKAIEDGFVKLCDDIRTQFMEEYPDEPTT
jgi:hypothetical protein